MATDLPRAHAAARTVDSGLSVLHRRRPHTAWITLSLGVDTARSDFSEIDSRLIVVLILAD